MTKAAAMIARGDRSARAALSHAVATGALSRLWEVWHVDDLPGWQSGFGRSRPTRRMCTTRDSAFRLIASGVVGALRGAWERCVRSGRESDAEFCERLRDDLAEAEHALATSRWASAIVIAGGAPDEEGTATRVSFTRGRECWIATEIAVRGDDDPPSGGPQAGSARSDALARKIARGDASPATALAYLVALGAVPSSAWVVEVDEPSGTYADLYLSYEAALEFASGRVADLVERLLGVRGTPATNRWPLTVFGQNVFERERIANEILGDHERGRHYRVLETWRDTPLVRVSVNLVKKELDL